MRSTLRRRRRRRQVTISAAWLLACVLLVLSAIGCGPAPEQPPQAPAPLPSLAPATATAGTASPRPTDPPPTTAPSPTAPPPTAESKRDGLPSPPDEGLVEVEVLEVIDGDTIRVALNGGRPLVRYIGVDAPEPGQGYLDYEWLGPEASALNAELLAGGRVWLERDTSETDHYNRLLRYIWVGDLLVNAELVRLGYAQAIAYPPDTRYSALFDRLEDDARTAGLGIWGVRPTSTPAPPAAEIGDDCTYIGNRNSLKFHYPDCEAVGKMHPANRVCLGSREEAIDGGYTPCGICRP